MIPRSERARNKNPNEYKAMKVPKLSCPIRSWTTLFTRIHADFTSRFRMTARLIFSNRFLIADCHLIGCQVKGFFGNYGSVHGIDAIHQGDPIDADLIRRV